MEKQPVKSGKIKCATHALDVIIGANGLMFCPNNSCANSEASYLGVPVIELSGYDLTQSN